MKLEGRRWRHFIRALPAIARGVPVLALPFLAACGGGPTGEVVRFTVPDGSGFGAVADTLARRDIIEYPTIFRLYARLEGVEREIKPGVYEVQRGIAWGDLIGKMVSGDVVELTVVVPEGWTLDEIAPRIAEATGAPSDSILTALLEEGVAERYGVPGPTLEGYLYPATYRFPLGWTPDQIVKAMVNRYHQVWTPERLARADSIGFSEKEVVTLASIVEQEAKRWPERDTIAAVYRNRLEIDMPLQADPTVQYALGDHQRRLLYEHIEEVADSPYNTYTRQGLPPGPIASPSAGAIDAALYPADVDFLYFVARMDGTHVFTRNLSEHNAARARIARARRAAETNPDG